MNFFKGVFEATLKGFLIILLFMLCEGKLSVIFSKKRYYFLKKL